MFLILKSIPIVVMNVGEKESLAYLRRRHVLPTPANGGHRVSQTKKPIGQNPTTTTARGRPRAAASAPRPDAHAGPILTDHTVHRNTDAPLSPIMSSLICISNGLSFRAAIASKRFDYFRHRHKISQNRPPAGCLPSHHSRSAGAGG